MLLMASGFGKNVPKYGAWCKICSLKYAAKFQLKCSWNKKAFLCHLLYASAFAHCENWLVKLTLGLEV
jgi:hypothetical protein